jgi:hypothetical protein
MLAKFKHVITAIQNRFTHIPTTDSLIFASLAIVISLIYWQLFSSQPSDVRSLAPGDLTTLFYPAAVYDVAMLQAGQLPLWNPYWLGGIPFFAQLQTQALYPIRWITAILVTVVSPQSGLSYLAFETEIIAHLVIASWGAYAYFKGLLSNRFGAVFGALAWSLSGYLTGYPIQHTPILYSAAWLGWLLWAIQRMLFAQNERFAIRYLALASGFNAMSIYAGMPQNTIYINLIVIGYFVWYWFAQAEHHRRTLKRYMGFLLMSICFAAPLLLPLAELTPLAERNQWSFVEKSVGFEIKDLIGLILPRLTMWSPLYVGVATIVLDVIAVRLPCNHAKCGQLGLWVTIFFVGLVLGVGAETFIMPMAYNIVPGFQSVRNHERAAIMIAWSLINIAMLSWQRIFIHPDDSLQNSLDLVRNVLGKLFSLGVGLLIFGVIWAQFQPINDTGRIHSILSRLAWAPIMVGLVIVLLRAKFTKNIMQFAWVLLVFFDLSTVAWQTARQNHLTSVPPQSVSDLPFQYQNLTNAKMPYRIDTRGYLNKDRMTLIPLEDLHGQVPLMLNHFVQFRALTPGERLWALMGVGCYVRDMAEPALPFESDLVLQMKSGENKQVGIFCLRKPFERFHMIFQAQVMDDKTALNALRDSNFDPLKTAILATDTSAFLSSTQNPSAQITLTSWAKQSMTLRVNTNANGILTIGDVWYPGWSAWVDGSPTPVLRAYTSLRAVAVPAGEHVVELSYRPISLIVGTFILFFACCVLILVYSKTRLS